MDGDVVVSMEGFTSEDNDVSSITGIKKAKVAEVKHMINWLRVWHRNYNITMPCNVIMTHKGNNMVKNSMTKPEITSPWPYMAYIMAYLSLTVKPMQLIPTAAF